MSMESVGTLGRAQHEPTIRMGNTQDNDRQQLLKPLRHGVALTGYRLLVTSVIVGIGIPKAVYSYYGQSLISPTLDWVGGVGFSLLLFWLGVIEVTSPELCPGFFQVDLAPAVLRFLRRDRAPPPLPISISVSQHQTSHIPSMPATYPSTNSRDPGSSYRDSVTSLSTAFSPSGAGPPISPTDTPPVRRTRGRVWDPDRGVEIFKKDSEEVLARFLKMGSWENSRSPT